MVKQYTLIFSSDPFFLGRSLILYVKGDDSKADILDKPSSGYVELWSKAEK